MESVAVAVTSLGGFTTFRIFSFSMLTATMRHWSPKIKKSSRRRLSLDVGAFCPMKSMKTPPWRYPREASPANGKEVTRCKRMHMMFGAIIALTW